ncbi:MAG: FGGY family carbohydrate kinase, partial [Oscillospiraceae bacterium]
MKTSVLAFDFGASSGRAIKAVLEDGALSWEEVHRFENIPLRQGGHLRWDFESLMENVHVGIAKAGTVDSIGFDTWGLDFGLLDREGKLLENPVHYRDTRTLGMADQACRKVPAARLYRWTGTQIMDMNTLFQLCTVDLSQTDKLLFMPDLLAYMLCGQAVCERSVASTGQMLDPKTGQWSEHVLTAF